MGNYAVFLHRVRRDHKAADAAYRAAVEAHPKHASILCRYGSFLKHVRRDPDKAQRMFEAAIAANPEHAESLGHLAVLLHGVRGDYEGAAALYERAVQCDSHNVNNLSNYGLFLAEVSVLAKFAFVTSIRLQPHFHSLLLQNIQMSSSEALCSTLV
jgi:Tfp pilus assembly protein PilF